MLPVGGNCELVDVRSIESLNSAGASTHSSFSPPIGAAKKTIVLPGGFEDQLTVASYVAETNLPTDVGHFRIRAYRIGGAPGSAEAQRTLKPHPLGAGAGLGSEPCVIYCTDKPPFGARGGERGGRTALPVRIHDQCFTSEVFRSQRLVRVIAETLFGGFNFFENIYLFGGGFYLKNARFLNLN